MSKTVNISMSEKDLKRIDEYCLIHNLTRSKFMLAASLQTIYAEDIANGLLLVNTYLRRAEDGKRIVNAEDRKLLEKALEYLGGVGN